MTPDFTIRYEVEEVSKMTTAYLSSKTVIAHDLPWKLMVSTENAARTDNVRHFQIFLSCNWETEKQMWRVEYEAEVAILNRGTEKMMHDVASFFDQDNKFRGFAKYETYENLLDAQRDLIEDDKVTVECRVKVGKVKGIRKMVILDFLTPSDHLTNVVLKIEDRTINVSKDLLAVNSPVLSATFFGNFEEQNKNEIELRDIVYKEFVDLLNLIYPSSFEIMAKNVHHLLKLADRFQVESVIERIVVYLMATDKFTTVAKLKLAEQYRLQELMDHCVNSFKSAEEIKAVKDTPEFKSFSDSLARAILDRILEF